MGNTGEERYNAKMKRVYDAIELRVPDRVPLVVGCEGFAAHYGGITMKEAMYEYDKTEKAYDKFFEDFDPDLAFDPVLMYPATPLDTLGLNWFRWPGNGLGDNTIYQFIEGEYMTVEDYDALIYDPTCFFLTRWIPRCFKNLSGLSNLYGLRDSSWLGFFNAFYPFSIPEVKESLKNLMKGADELAQWFAFLTRYSEKLKSKGFPTFWGAFAFAPFDILGDTLRGTENLLFDLKDRPEKVLAAVEKLTPIAIESGIRGAQATGRKFVWIWLHKGTDDFMSQEDYMTFYWPPLKKLINGLIDAGLTPMVYGEGKMDKRVESYLELPKGKICLHLEYADMKRAKEILKGHVCISGNVPSDVIHYGTPDEVKKHCKYLIDNVAPGGGYMMDAAALIDDAKPENVKAIFDYTMEYGKY